MGNGKDSSEFTHASIVSRPSFNPEQLVETYQPISELNDDLIKLFLEIWGSMPDLDSVTANKRLKSQGLILRLVDGFNSMLGGNKNRKNSETN